MQKQPLLHQPSPKGKEKADAPPENGKSEPSANGNEAGGSEEQEGDAVKDRGEHWHAVEAAEANEPVGIITIEDVLEELIGQVLLCLPACLCICSQNAL